jgi:AcrR family transcriptional regulator
VTARLPRSDARDNRGRILDAACATFVAAGLEVPVREIARHAQVGPATVYRHFPTKQMLLAAAFIEQSRVWRAVLEDGVADPDPWRGFRLAVSRLCEMQACDLGFAAAFKSAFPRAVDFAGLRTSSLVSAAALVGRAKKTGHLRADVGLDDLLLMLMASNGIRAGNPTARIAASRRYAELTILAFRTSDTDLPVGRLQGRARAEGLPSG